MSAKDIVFSESARSAILRVAERTDAEQPA